MVPANPLDITVVIPTFNRSSSIGRALDSVRAQTRLPRAVVVVDDASTDDTVASVEKWSWQQDFPVEIIQLPKNMGPGAARNRGIAYASTRYVGFLDSDDEYLPDALETLISMAGRYPDVALSFADATVVSSGGEEHHGLVGGKVLQKEELGSKDGEETVFRLPNATTALLKASIIPTSATCFRRDAALRVGGMPESFRAGEDWLFWLRLAGEGSFVFQLRDIVLHHRHSGNLTHPDSAEFVSREKLRGYIALERGHVGVRLSSDQKRALGRHIERQARTWRYNLSRLGLRDYAHGIRSEVGRSIGSPIRHVIDDPRALLRAAYWSVDHFGNRREVAHGL